MKENLLTKEYLDQKLSHFDQKLSHFDQKLNHLDQKLSHLDQKLSHLDQKLSHFITRDYLDQKFDEKFDEFARIIAGEFKDVRSEIYDLEVDMNGRFDSVDKNFGRVFEQIGRIETRFGHLDDVVLKDHTPRIRRLEDEMGI